MPLLDLTDQEAQSLLNIVATTKEHAWLVTNPLVQKIGALLQQKDSPHGGVDQERRVAEHGERPIHPNILKDDRDNGAGPRPYYDTAGRPHNTPAGADAANARLSPGYPD